MKFKLVPCHPLTSNDNDTYKFPDNLHTIYEKVVVIFVKKLTASKTSNFVYDKEWQRKDSRHLDKDMSKQRQR